MKKLANPVSAAIFVFLNALSLFTVYKRLSNDLGIELFGIWSLILTFNVFFPFFFMGYIGALQRFIPEFQSLDLVSKSAKLIKTTFTIVFISSALILFILYLISPYLILRINNPEFFRVLHDNREVCLLYIFTSTITLVLYSVLDGFNKVYLKNIVLSTQSLFLLIGSFLLHRSFNFNDTANLFFHSSLLAFVLAILIIWIFLKINPAKLIGFDSQILESTKNYNTHYLKSNMFGLLLEPINKTLLLFFAGPGSVAVYEMASKFVLQARTLLVSVVLSLMPYVSKTNIKSPEKIRGIYTFLFKINLQLSGITFYLVTLALPFLSIYWFKTLNHDFLRISYLLILGWFINNLCLPAYAINTATNGIAQNTKASFYILIINIATGLILGFAGFKLYTITSWVIGLIFGGVFLIVIYNKANDIKDYFTRFNILQILLFVTILILYINWITVVIDIKNVFDFLWMPIILSVAIGLLSLIINRNLIVNVLKGKFI